jgi:hypothetical protein
MCARRKSKLVRTRLTEDATDPEIGKRVCELYRRGDNPIARHLRLRTRVVADYLSAAGIRPPRKARLYDVKKVLAEGGFIRFTWATGTAELVGASAVRPVSAPAYLALTKRYNVEKKETGSVETGDLVIEWRRR